MRLALSAAVVLFCASVFWQSMLAQAQTLSASSPGVAEGAITASQQAALQRAAIARTDYLAIIALQTNLKIEAKEARDANLAETAAGLIVSLKSLEPYVEKSRSYYLSCKKTAEHPQPGQDRHQR